MRNLILSAALFSLSLFGLSVQADSIEAGRQYTELSSPVPVSQPGKIEVVELFWYGCPHCYQFEPTLNPWVEKLPGDVNFVRVPAMFGGIWDVHGQLFITLESMGVERQVHDAVFEAIHKEKRKLATPEEMAEFLAAHGVDKGKFLSTFNSFAVKGQMAKAKKLAMSYQITGVPVLIVNGKFRFDISSSGGENQALEVANFLIQKERSAN
ncbi:MULTISPECIES: thiol:disulfide interchange protein DsbA/DsbL [unclassified Pseudomonas]|uniref:thiol:disulfide interchange protein DsbA/DsbL n=1 Tax=unclassified Pseudomonas TaxID=196821 RepID=UPI00244B0037|nr:MULTISPECIES: thiol:disulfide interchange protein DsbA/DsbL [unclassified Pseudomonas]MDG9929032.1 thiol:disulfide interchange protein DsbA/DsbL [Pseudomonas sp. GD04042]MDH0483745.1 thiol:disulfide interchange protein DsbA/DsbL [Pseudomonas sp. GD04015]MDH0604956.1 thiol:disulfide interchange protein DsbA/DsbL [Pseudomonas sp. GD03869]